MSRIRWILVGLGTAVSFLTAAGSGIAGSYAPQLMAHHVYGGDTKTGYVWAAWAGKDGDVTIQLPPGAQSAVETDLMEKPMGSVSLHDGKVSLHSKPYEIKTIKVQFSSLPQMATSKP